MFLYKLNYNGINLNPNQKIKKALKMKKIIYIK